MARSTFYRISPRGKHHSEWRLRDAPQYVIIPYKQGNWDGYLLYEEIASRAYPLGLLRDLTIAKASAITIAIRDGRIK